MKNRIFLSICILTYNRFQKLNNLLLNLREQIKKTDYRNNIEIIIGDNCSTDETFDVVGKNKIYFKNTLFRYYKHPINLGFDKNCDFLYRKASGEYIWFFGDNAILEDGAVSKVYKNLLTHKPSAMLFSFIQGDAFSPENPTFNIARPVELVTDEEKAIRAIIKWPKVSIYIIKKKLLKKEDDAILNKYLDTGYRHLVLMLYVFLESKEHSLLIHREPLARAYDDCLNIRFNPLIFSKLKTAASLPYIMKNYPQILAEMSGLPEAEAIMINFLITDYLGKIKIDEAVRESSYIYFKRNIAKLLINKKTRPLALKFIIVKTVPMPLTLKYFLFKKMVRLYRKFRNFISDK